MRQAVYELIRLLICLFFFLDALTSVNPFLNRIPRELHEQYMTGFMAEFMKMPETNKTTDDGAISLKYDLIVAFARKS